MLKANFPPGRIQRSLEVSNPGPQFPGSANPAQKPGTTARLASVIRMLTLYAMLCWLRGVCGKGSTPTDPVVLNLFHAILSFLIFVQFCA